jgi:two-component system, NarL family, invasion response regulator UvrY
MSFGMSAITVLLVDDHAVVREGYKRLLERSGDIAVIGEAATANDAYRMFSDLHPHIVVMDIALPGVSGIEALRRLRARQSGDACVLMFSMYGDVVYARRALEAGAVGYLTKASAPEVLVEAVRTVARGQQYLSHDIAQAMALRSEREQPPNSELTVREHEVLRLWMQGRTLNEIGSALGISPKTAANIQSSVKQKLKVETTAQLWLAAASKGLVPDKAITLGLNQ